VVAGLAVAAFAFVLPLLFAGSPPPPPPPPQGLDCPATPAQLAGRHFTSVGAIPSGLNCADLRGAVFDGLELIWPT
jgi:hypothetical protein